MLTGLRIHQQRAMRAALATALLGAVLAPAPGGASHTVGPAPWIDAFCSGGATSGCWNPIPSLANPVQDCSAAGGDDTKNSAPNPASADIWNGSTSATCQSSGNLNSVFYAYNDRGTASPDDDDDMMYFRMRLLDTPLDGTNPLGNSGPYDANTAWLFVLDLDGDGWADYLNATDGNTGKNQSPYDDMQLGFNTSTTRQDLTNTNLCTAGGQVLFRRDATDPATATCAGSTAPICDFGWTRVVNCQNPTSCPAACDSCPNGGYLLDMQFPLDVFDSCTGTDTDADGIGGDQVMTPTTPFIFCATTSTQPNDPTGKDLGANGSYRMRKDRRLPCGDVCRLSEGCSQKPVLLGMTATCGTGVNSSPVTLEAEVLDTLVPNAAGDDSVDTIDNVLFEYSTSSGGPWTTAAPAAGSANPVTDPTGQPNLWRMLWDTTAVDPGTYFIRVTITDDQGNVTVDVLPDTITLPGGCNVTTTPVTLSSFHARRQGGDLEISWTTATEAGNVGFNLYAETADGWAKLNGALVPSGAVDSTEPLRYRLTTDDPGSTRFFLEDVNVHGESTLHGPFTVGVRHGGEVAPEAIDWAAIRAEHRTRADGRRGGGGSGPWTAVTASASHRGGRGGHGGGGGGSATFSPVELLVREDGLYRLSYEDLLAAGFDLAGAPSAQLALLNRGAPVAIRVEAGEAFGPGAFVEFWGEALDTLYTTENVYTLTADASRARRVGVDRSPLGRLHNATPEASYLETREFGRNREYSFGSPTGDPWYDTRMLAQSPGQWSFDFAVDGYGGRPASLSVHLWGWADWPGDPDHHAVVRLNGAEVAERFFDGVVDAPFSVPLPAGLLREGANTLTVELPADLGFPWDLVNLEGYAVTYPRAFAARGGELHFQGAGQLFRVEGLPEAEVVAYRGSAASPTRVADVAVAAGGGGFSATFPGTGSPATYRVASASALRTPGIRAARPPRDITGGSAGYLVLSHPDFLGGLDPLLAERRSQGLDIRVVDVEDVYAQFGYGIFDPGAIRDYIRYAAANLGTEYVLLVGGDTYDYHDYLGRGAMSFLPSLYTPTGDLVRFAPSDALYADVDGNGVPDLAIGRLPVRTAAELGALVGKTLSYGAKDFHRTSIFAADRFDPGGNVSFTQASERFIGGLPGGWSVDRAYLDQMTVADARAALLAAIDAGVAVTSFVGHSGPASWTFANLFNTTDAAGLANAGRPTVVTQWGCWNTYYVSPSANTLGHKLLLSGDLGAAAVLGATTLTRHGAEEALGTLLTPRLVEPGKTLGMAILEAKRELGSHQPGLADVLLGWNLLGDPALVVDP